MPPDDGAAWAAAARDALRRVDEALADRPKRDGATLKAAIQALVRARDGLAAVHRRDAGARPRATLEGINAVVSVVMAAAFPIGEVPWAELERARGWLAAVVDEASAQSSVEPGPRAVDRRGAGSGTSTASNPAGPGTPLGRP